MSLQPLLISALPAQQEATYRQGRLSNGLTYYIRHNAAEPGLASFYLAQRVGSILEMPHQRGLAHFLEHMAFNGSTHFRGEGASPGLVSWCESVGIKFGTNLNACTGVDRTVYHISAAPVRRQGVTDSCLLILRDWCDGLLLNEKAIDKERGVVREEWRTRRTGMAVARMMEDAFPVIFKGSKYEDAMPIGHLDVINNFSPDALRDYYNKWYRPDLQAVVIVGDVDVNAIENQIKQLFGDISLPPNAPQRRYYPVADNERMITHVMRDAEQPIALAHLYMKRDAKPTSARSDEHYRKEIYEKDLICLMLNERLSKRQSEAKAPFTAASVKDGKFLIVQTKNAFSLSVSCKGDQVEEGLSAAVGLIEQARQKGFTTEELTRAKAILRNKAERCDKQRGQLANHHYVKQCLDHYLYGEPILSAAEELYLRRKFDVELTLANVNATIKELVTDRNQVLLLYAPQKADFRVPSTEQLERCVRAAQEQTYPAYQESARPKMPLTTFPKPGKILAEYDHTKAGVRVFKLSNGINVYVKLATFGADQVSFKLFGKGGKQLFPDEDAPNLALLKGAMEAGGWGQLSATDLRSWLAGKSMRVAPFIHERTQGVEGTASTKDLRALFELTYLYVTQPRKDQVAYEGFKERMQSFLVNREANPNVTYNDSIAAARYGNNPRTAPTTMETLEKADYERMQAIYRQLFCEMNDCNVILVGNIDLQTLRPLLCRYVASLPAATGIGTQRSKTLPAVRDVDETYIYRRRQATPYASVSIFYDFELPYEPKSSITLNAFKHILQMMYTDTIREKSGGAYNVSVITELDNLKTPNALLKIAFRTDPQRYEELIPLVYKQLKRLAEQGPAQELLQKSKEFLLKAHQQQARSCHYWLHILYNIVYNGVDFDADYEKMTQEVSAQDVQQLCKALLAQKRRIEVTMLPLEAK